MGKRSEQTYDQRLLQHTQHCMLLGKFKLNQLGDTINYTSTRMDKIQDSEYTKC
jgi:hypothetical protein